MRTSIMAVAALVALGGAGAYVLDRYGIDGAIQFASGKAAATAGEGKAAGQPAAKGGAGRQAARGAVPVETVKAQQVASTADIRSVGSLQSDESVQIASEVAGRVSAILFKEGQQVKAGDVLVKFDDTLARAELVEAEARLELAEANFTRTNALAQSGNTTQRARDEAVSAAATTRAVVELIRSRIGKLSIAAPFPGIVGIRKVSVGAFLNPGTAIVNLEKIDELKVDFKIPELHLAQVRPGQTVEVTVDALPGRTFTGTIYAIDPLVDVNGRALTIRARLPNPALELRPGLFARILVKGQAEKNVVVVPEEAIVPRGQQTLVYRIEDGKAVETKVRLGARRAGTVEILEGLPAGATVVTAGHTRLRNGAAVEAVTPATATQS